MSPAPKIVIAILCVLIASGLAACAPVQVSAVEQPRLRPVPVKPIQEYRACGCGCCGQADPDRGYQCVMSLERLEAIKRADEKASRAPHCAVAGCSLGTVYRLCK